MKIRGIRYFFSEAFKNIFSNGWMTIASIFTVIASLLVFGVFSVLTVNISGIVGDMEDSYQILVYIDDKVNYDGVRTIGEEIKETDNVSDATLITKDERFNNFRDGMGPKGTTLNRFEDDNPLRDMYMVTLDDLSMSEDTIKVLERIDGVDEIQRNEDAINKLVTIANYIQTFSLWIMIALAIVSVFIISNTIKLTVYTRRKEINIMKFVGATDWFIRWPFIIEGIFIGLIGAGVSIGLVIGGYSLLTGIISSLNIGFITMKPLSEIVTLIVCSSLGLGAVLGGIGSFISVRKHLNV
ncbi:MAG: permease-like cell division protein FtsX [Clostridia bacterium]|nr:permease-like cell division protein FtsX [Clostridia bacterium]